MTGSQAERLARRWFEDLFNEGETGVADEILAPEVQYHGPPSLSPTEVRTPEDVKRYVEIYRRAFPDFRYSIEEVFASGGRVAARWTATGTHRSELFGMEPEGELFTTEGLNVFAVEDGRITEVWSEWDTLGMVRELEIVPPVGHEIE